MNTIKLSFMGVQPIDIDSKLYIDLIVQKISFDKLNNIAKKDYSYEWLKSYSNIYDVYSDLYEFDIPNDGMDLKKDYFRSYSALNMHNKSLDLSRYLLKYTAKLLFDPRFVYFILIYQIELEIPEDVLVDFLDYDATQNNFEYKDLYNTVRKAIARENSNSQLSSWGTAIEKNTLKTVQNTLKYLYKKKINDTDLKILPNSCNITNIVLVSTDVDTRTIDKLTNLNIYAERLSSEIKIEPLYNKTVYFSFNGRFHTIILKNLQDKYRFQPLQFHIQYMWFLVERYNKIMNTINKELMQTESFKSLQRYSRLIHAMINKIELLSLHDMNFKHSIEVDIEIYEKNERRWSISKLLESSKQYVSFFKDYLDRLFSQKNEIFQKKLNLILLVISFLQLLALVSVWNDYLSTVNRSNLNIDNRLLDLFDGEIDKLLSFNLYLPIFFIIIMAIFSIYLWRHRAK